MFQILDGRALAKRIRDKIKSRVEQLDTPPGLAVILVGNDPASHTYVGKKQKACEEAGIYFEQFLYFATEPEEKIIEKIKELNIRNDIHGILVQLPLPSQDANRIIAEIDPKKDVDGFHKKNIEALKAGKPAIAPAVALGIMKLVSEAIRLSTTRSKATRSKATIISSKLFAEPLIPLLHKVDIETEVVGANDAELSNKTKTADILIVAVGKPGMITGNMIKPGAIVIDVGTTKINGHLLGDVDFTSAEEVAGFLTPVPGGVGPMTVAMLLVNVLKAYRLLALQ